MIVQIDNSYLGQVYQVAQAIWAHGSAVLCAKNVIVVDEDIDIFDLNKVFWAIGYRVDPPRDIIQFPGWISALDPIVPPSRRMSAGGNKGTRLLIDATKPQDYPRDPAWFGQKFAVVCYPDDETMKNVRAKWSKYGIKTHK